MARGVPVYQETRERKVHLAIGCGRSSDDLAGTDELPVVRNRLAQPARNPASDAGRITVLGLNLLLDLIQWLHDIEAGRPSIGPCQCSGSELSANEALIVHLELRIEKLKRELYGQRSERTAQLIE
jgi:hypothetical protein